MKTEHLSWWNNLRHGGLLLDLQRLGDLVPEMPVPLPEGQQERLRREIIAFQNDPEEKRGRFVAYILETICGFSAALGEWNRGSHVTAAWTRRGMTGESLRPSHLWLDANGASLPVFMDTEKRLGIGRGKRVVSRCLQWLRQGREQLALVTNGHQWRIVFAGLDYEAWTEWDLEQWMAEGAFTDEFNALRALISPPLWRGTAPSERTGTVPSERSETGLSLSPKDRPGTVPSEHKEAGTDASERSETCLSLASDLPFTKYQDRPGSARVSPGISPLLEAINNSRKGQSELSKELGERVRMAAELLIDGHAPALNPLHGQLDAQDIYRAAVRVIMRMVVILFAESREGLLPRDNPVYHTAYSLQGLRELLDRSGKSRLVSGYSAWPRMLALFRMVCQGSSHEAMPVPKYGGDLFAPGDFNVSDGVKRALHVFENACFAQDIMNDGLVRDMLELLTRTRVAIRQGRATTWTMMPVDFSSLGNEYIGILYEGLLDFELRCGVEDQPIVFLAVGNQPALPLATLEAMDDKAIKNLFEKMKDSSVKSDEGEDGEGEDTDLEESESEEESGEELEEETENIPEETAAEENDPRFTLRARAEQWARHAVETAGLVTKPRGKMTPEKKMDYERTLTARARQLITKVVLPGEWYLVRWGGTRKGSGTFYTVPPLAMPTVHRTLEPLCYDVDGGQWSVDGENKENKDALTELRGTGGVAEINGVGDTGVQTDPEVSQGGNIRINQSVAPRGSVSSLEHSGRPGTTLNKRVSEPSVNGAGIPAGSGDADGNRTQTGVSDSGTENGSTGINPDSGSPAQWSHSRPGTEGGQRPVTGVRNPATDHRPQSTKTPKPPEQILALKVCDPACGSGSFPLAALRYLTNALYESAYLSQTHPGKQRPRRYRTHL